MNAIELWIGWVAVTILLYALVMGAMRLLDWWEYRRTIARRLRDLP